MKKKKHSKKYIINVLLLLIIISFFVSYFQESNQSQNMVFEIETIDTKNIAKINVSEKKDPRIHTEEEEKRVIKDLKGFSPIVEQKIEPTPAKRWYLPVQVGRITTYPNYYHMAYDITSYRGSAETIYPIYDGVVSSIYYDSAGALIVTVRHHVDGITYTSQYVHLSRFADGLHVGQVVDPHTPLGQMGTTGFSTGIHLHIAVLDCDLYNPNDTRCRNLNEFSAYAKRRFNEGYRGLGSLINVPYSWESRE